MLRFNKLIIAGLIGALVWMNLSVAFHALCRGDRAEHQMSCCSVASPASPSRHTLHLAKSGCGCELFVASPATVLPFMASNPRSGDMDGSKKRFCEVRQRACQDIMVRTMTLSETGSRIHHSSQSSIYVLHSTYLL